MKLLRTVFLFLVLLPIEIFSQNISIDSVSNYFYTQTHLFPQEKVYVQTDRALYSVGDTIWFKAYLVTSKSHIADSKSNFIYAELINSVNDVVERVKIRKIDGSFSGYINIVEERIPGVYQLRFYTNNMTNIDEMYLFKKKIRIDNYMSLRFKTNTTFKFDDKEDSLKMELTLYDNLTSKTKKLDKLYIYDDKGDKNNVRLGDGETIYIKVKPSEVVNNCILIEYETSGYTHKEFVSIPLRDDDFTVSFFPEGGTLLQETVNKVSFKAINSSGMGEDITGYIVSSLGDTLLQFASTHLGMGMFFLITNKDQLYAVCRNSSGAEKRFALPLAHDNLLSLQTAWNGNNLFVGINKPKSYSPSKTLYLILHCRGEILYSKTWNNQYRYISVESNKLPSGVIHALLLDENLNPISERLVFNKNVSDLSKTILTTSKKESNFIEHIDISVLVTNDALEPLSGNFSVSVLKSHSVDTSSNIFSTLLLTSDLQGYIESSADYFTSDINNRQNLDLLMMTQGWRRYNVSKILQQEYEYPLVGIEQFQSISGTVNKIYGRGRGAANYPVLLFSVDNAQTTTAITNDQGNFIFPNISFPDSTKFVVQSTSPKGGDDVKIKVDRFTFAPQSTLLPFLKIENKSTKISESKLPYKTEVVEKLLATMPIHHLDEVVVKGRHTIKLKPVKHWASSEFSIKVTSKEIERMYASRLMDVLRKTSGIWVEWLKMPEDKVAKEYLTIRGAKAVVLLDGMVIDHSQLNAIIPITVASIEVLKPPLSFALGPKGINGAVLITTTSGGSSYDDIKPENIALISPLGYQITKEFYSPQYDVNEELERKTSDDRTTIYWNPNIKLTEKRTSSFNFYNSNTEEDYVVVIEGITADGSIIYKVGSLKDL